MPFGSDPLIRIANFYSVPSMREVDTLRMTPCLPPEWETFTLHYRFRETLYPITVAQTRGESVRMVVLVDGVNVVGCDHVE